MDLFEVLQIYNETINNFLYHFTTLHYIDDILKTNKLIPHEMQKDVGGMIYTGVSVTRKKDFYMNDEDSICIILDKDKLKQDYKIIPFNPHRKSKYKSSLLSYRMNSEEIVVTGKKGLINLDKYIVNIIYPENK